MFTRVLMFVLALVMCAGVSVVDAKKNVETNNSKPDVVKLFWFDEMEVHTPKRVRFHHHAFQTEEQSQLFVFWFEKTKKTKGGKQVYDYFSISADSKSVDDAVFKNIPFSIKHEGYVLSLSKTPKVRLKLVLSLAPKDTAKVGDKVKNAKPSKANPEGKKSKGK